MRKLTTGPVFLCCLFVFASCSIQKQLAKQAKKNILSNPDFASAHVGISVYDPAANSYLYNYQAEKLFVPASNMKLFTCYEAMKSLGDSLTALRYVDKGNGTIEVEANGDASFLMPDFKTHPAYDFLRKQKRVLLTDANWKDNGLGAGWAWDDYNADYMAERSVMPIYGNLVHITRTGYAFHSVPAFQQALNEASGLLDTKGNVSIRRVINENKFLMRAINGNNFTSADVPFSTRENNLLIRLLNDTLGNKVEQTHVTIDRLPDVIKIKSQPTDSLLKIMMHRSDNFFAEQTLLMISNEKLGYMSDARIIDTLLKTDFKELPQKPKWVDGSGLSRYNLISPNDFVWVLTQMKNEFKWERIQTILATGGEGTLGSYYKNYTGRIYAKTGSLSNHLALSGYLITKKGKQLIFSVLVNAETVPAANIRKGVEKFLTGIIDRY